MEKLPELARGHDLKPVNATDVLITAAEFLIVLFVALIWWIEHR